MSIHSVTIGQLMTLGLKQLNLAVRLCDEEISVLHEGTLKLISPTDESYESTLDEISTAITLRKVLVARRDELQAEANETDGSTSEHALVNASH